MQGSHKEMPPIFYAIAYFKENNQFITAVLEHCQSFVSCVNKIAKSDLASSCLSIHPSAWNSSAPTGWIFMQFDT